VTDLLRRHAYRYAPDWVYLYRVSFPPPGETAAVPRPIKPAYLESEVPYEVGSRIEHEGREWVVILAPLDQQTLGSYADIEVWPAEP
jgi:hypothetical protein